MKVYSIVVPPEPDQLRTC